MPKDLKILFITLPQRGYPDKFPPYGPMAVIASLHRAGYKNTVFYHLDVLRPARQEAIDYIVSLRPNILGISSPVSTAYESCKFFSLEVKKRLPDTKIILGGNLATSAEILLRKTGVDFCVLGEGEKVCCHLFDKIGENRPISNFYSISGLAFLDGEKFVNTGYAEQIPKEEIFNVDWNILDAVSIKHYFPKLNELASDSVYLKYFFPNLSDGQNCQFILNDRDLANKTTGVISCSKGCVGRCTYCHRFTKGIRILPVEIAINRIKDLIARFNIGAIAFGDECFGSSAKWLQEFCETIKPLKLLWKVGAMRVDMVTPDIIEMMKDAGCRSIIFGMETGSERILKVMEKKVSFEDNYKAMQWVTEAGLYTIPQLVIGMPGETPETIRETADFIARSMTLNKSQNPHEISINFAQALPGTPLYEYGRSIGKIGATLDEEEKYLLTISDKEAAEGDTTINFTDYPRLVLLSWPKLINIIVDYSYVKKFGLQQFYKIIFSGDAYPNIFSLIRKGKFDSIFYLYPQLSRKLKNLVWILTVIKVFKSSGFTNVFMSLKEYLLFRMRDSLKINRKSVFEYTSLRKIVEQKTKDSYLGTKEMEPLRKGR